MMCTAISFTGFRLLSNAILRGAVAKDDWFICLATILAIAQTISTSSMVAHGLGQHEDSVDSASIARFQKVSREY